MNSTGNTTVTSIDTVLEYQALYEAAVQRCRARRQQREARRRAEESRQEDERREWRREFIAAHRTLYANTGWSTKSLMSLLGGECEICTPHITVFNRYILQGQIKAKQDPVGPTLHLVRAKNITANIAIVRVPVGYHQPPTSPLTRLGICRQSLIIRKLYVNPLQIRLCSCKKPTL